MIIIKIREVLVARVKNEIVLIISYYVMSKSKSVTLKTNHYPLV